MTIDLNTLREKDLRNFSYQDTLSVISALERVNPLQFSEIEALESIETYYSFILIINDRISNNEFNELKANNKKREKELLQSRLILLINTFSFSLDANNLLQSQTDKVIAWGTEVSRRLESRSQEIERIVENKKAELDNKVTLVVEQMNDSEHTILTHVLTLMGIFSAIITIIMSVVVTSTSWLNNADGATAIFAFAIPNSVVLLSVIVLVFLIYLYNNMGEPARKKEQVNRILNNGTLPGKNIPKTSIVVISVILVIIITLSVVLAWLAATYTSPGRNPHMRYIITPSEYTVIKEGECEPNCRSNDYQRYFNFDFEGINYRFLYDETYIHDGNLYYCSEHNQLE